MDRGDSRKSRCVDKRRLNRARYVLATGFVLVVGLAPESLAQECNGQIQVTKTFEPETVLAGDPVTVFVHVHGCSGQVVDPVPFDAVLVIDQSDSMDWNDPNDKRIDAAEDFVDCAPYGSRLGLVWFNDDAHVDSGMTTDRATLHSKLDDLRGDEGGGTNIHDSLVKAHQLLAGSTLETFVVLLTDGEDNSSHPDSDFMVLLDDAITREIRYLTIALGGDADTWMLRYFADQTVGSFAESPSADELANAFDDACKYAGSLTKTREIALKERVSSAYSTRPSVGSFETDIESITPGQISTFYANGSIDADIGSLGSGEGRFIKFDVTADCLQPNSAEDSVLVDIDDPNSIVEYVYGVDHATAQVPMKKFECLRPGEIRIKKRFDEASFKLELEVENAYLPDPEGIEDNTLRGLMVWDRPSLFFQADFDSVSPIDGADSFPDAFTDVVHWGLGDLAPKEKKVVSVQLESRVCSGTYDPPIPVNATKYTGGRPGLISYTSPIGVRTKREVPFKSTNLLPPIASCPGRPDLFITGAYTFKEFQTSTQFVRRGVKNSLDSEGIWVDSREDSGYWNRTIANLSAITGAHEVQEDGVLAPLAKRVGVDGQGDLFYLSTSSPPFIYCRFFNTGEIASDAEPQGLKVFVYNFTDDRWDLLGAKDMPAIEVNSGELVAVRAEVTQVRQSLHVRPYKMRPREALMALEEIAPTFAAQVQQALNQDPALFLQFQSMGPCVPSDVIAILPSNLGTLLSNRLNGLGYDFAWGKPSIRIRVEAGTANGDAHTNNNFAEQAVLVK